MVGPLLPQNRSLGDQAPGARRFQMDGFLIFDQAVDFLYIVLNRADPLAKELRVGLHSLLAQEHVAVTLGET